MPRRRVKLGRPSLVTLAAVICTALIFVPTPGGAAGKRRAARRPVPPRPAPEPPAYGTRGVDEEHVHVRRGDTFGGLLAARGVDGREVQRWIEAAASVYDLRRLRPRRGLTLRFDRATRTLEAVRYEIDDHALLLLDRMPSAIRAERGALPYVTELKGVARRIERGLRPDAAAAGVPESVLAELADVFGWELDLAGDLRPGDEFRLVYENIWQAGGTAAGPGRLLGAEIVAEGKPITAVYFEDADGRGGYFRPDGRPLSREFLRYPVEFTEITSEFSLLRRHPITRRHRPHLGVDLAAPVGTPVRAVADGTVVEAGWVRRLGRTIRIEHDQLLASTYGHLSRLASGVLAGASVERGQVIGYVGATGLATGPHLHFALERGGEHIDPLGMTAAAEAGVPEAARGDFERVRTKIVAALARLRGAGAPLAVSQTGAE